jgi:malonate decarboxylase alpha subunit
VDRDGNRFSGLNREGAPTVVEATAFKNGVVIAQVNEIVDKVPRVDIPVDRSLPSVIYRSNSK